MERTPRSTIRRHPERGSYDRAVIYEILDAGRVAHVGFASDGQPYVVPMIYGRLGDQLVLHGAIASRMLKHGASGFALCATVTILDALVLARSWLHHSMNYRSVVVLGRAHEIVEPDAKWRALAAVMDHVLPGRSAESRAPSAKELAATCVLALSIEEASAKRRTGGPIETAEDLALPWWAGVVPLTLVAGRPEPDPGAAHAALPESVMRLVL